MKKNKILCLAACTLLGLGVVSCGGDDPSKESTLMNQSYVKWEDVQKDVTLSKENIKVSKTGNYKYFAPQLVRRSETDGTEKFISTKSEAVMESGDVANLFAYEVPEGSKFGVTVKNGRTKADASGIVSADGKVVAPEVLEPTDFAISLYSQKDSKVVAKKLHLTVVPKGTIGKNDYFDYSSLNGTEREKMTVTAEKYLINNGLAPLTYADNAQFELYTERVHSPLLDKNNYVPGYGFGIEEYGWIDKSKPLPDAQKTPKFANFFWDQYAADQDTGNFNYLDSNSNSVAVLYNYISQSYFRQLLNADSTGTEYTSGLSRKNAPEAVNPDAKGASNTWKVYLRVGEGTGEGVTKGLNYRTASTNPEIQKFNNRPIKLEDYLTPWKLLATKTTQYYRGAEQAGESTPNRQIKGFPEFYQSSDKFTTNLPTDEEFQKALGVKLNKADNSITVTFNGTVTPDYAEYQLNGLWCNPIPEDFLKVIGTNAIEGAKAVGKTSGKLSPIDTTLSVGPYYLETYEPKKTIAFKKNETWPLTKDGHNRDLYKLEGVHLNCNAALSTDPNNLITLFEGGSTDRSDIPQTFFDKYLTDPRKKATKGTGYFPVYFVNTYDKMFWDTRFDTTENDWEVKPMLSNENFYKALLVGVDRNELAEYYHVNPAFGIQEPINKVSPKAEVAYNDSKAHKDVMKELFGKEYSSSEDFNSWRNDAATLFEKAIEEELEAGHYELGTKDNPTVVEFVLASTDDAIRKQSNLYVFGDWQDAFNLAVSTHFGENNENNWMDGNKPLIKLEPKAHEYSTNMGDNDLQKNVIDLGVKAGKFDGQEVFRVSGNPYDTFNNIEKYKTNDSSGFTLNFGANTDVVSKDMTYNNKVWSFDTLWSAGNGGVFANDFGGEKSVFSVDQNNAEIKKVDDGFDVTLPVYFDANYVDAKSIKISRLEIAGDKESYVELPVTIKDGKVTIHFSGNSLIPSEDVSNGNIQGQKYLEFKFNYDINVKGEVKHQELGGYFLA